MPIRKFEDIVAWQKSRVLVNDIYGRFRDCRDFAFKDQILRSSLSIMNNLAEGFDRMGDKEFRYFIKISQGSCGETRSMLYVALDRGYIKSEDMAKLYGQLHEIRRMLVALSSAVISKT